MGTLLIIIYVKCLTLFHISFLYIIYFIYSEFNILWFFRHAIYFDYYINQKKKCILFCLEICCIFHHFRESYHPNTIVHVFKSPSQCKNIYIYVFKVKVQISDYVSMASTVIMPEYVPIKIQCSVVAKAWMLQTAHCLSPSTPTPCQLCDLGQIT